MRHDVYETQWMATTMAVFKIKTFQGLHTAALEREIALWLAAQPSVRIVQRTELRERATASPFAPPAVLVTVWSEYT